MRGALITLALIVIGVKLLVWWLEPRMAFFPWRGVQQTPAAYGLAYTDHRITTADGETLHGWWMEHASPRAQVIYWHGNGGNLSLWLDVVADIHKRGFDVFAVDYRGYGGSTGTTERAGDLPRWRGRNGLFQRETAAEGRAGALLGTFPRLLGGFVRGVPDAT